MQVSVGTMTGDKYIICRLPQSFQSLQGHQYFQALAFIEPVHQLRHSHLTMALPASSLQECGQIEAVRLPLE